MATTIASTTIRTAGYNPIHYDGSAYYAVTIDGTNNFLHVYKASTLTGTWSEVDSADAPTDFAMGVGVNSWMHTLLDSAGYLHILVTRNIVYNLYYYQFNTNTDQWTTGLPTTQYFLVNTVVDDKTGTSGAICELGNGDIVIAFTGPNERVMGGDKLRVDYILSTDNGATWGSLVALDAAGDIHYGNPVCAPGSQTTDVHFLWQRQTDDTNDPPITWVDLEGRTLSSSSLSTTVTTAGAGTSSQLRGITNAISTNTGSVQRMVVGGADNNQDLLYSRSDEDGSNDLSAPVVQRAAATSPLIKIEDEAAHISVVEDAGGDIHWIYSDSGSSDIYRLRSNDSGDNLISQTALELSDLVTCNWPSVSMDSVFYVVIYENGTGTTVVDTFSSLPPQPSMPALARLPQAITWRK